MAQPRNNAAYNRMPETSVSDDELLGNTVRALMAPHTTDTYYRLQYATMEYDYVSPTIERLLGYSAAEFKALQLRSIIEETRMVPQAMQRVTQFDALEEARRRGDVVHWHTDYRMRAKDGRSVWVSDISYPWVDDAGEVIGSIGCLRNITERVQAEQLWQEERLRLANHDALTGLHDREYLFNRMDQEVKRARRSQADLSMAVIDIDKFRDVNDVYGMPVGDAVLRVVAERIRSCLRDTDLPARMNGGEYAVMLPDTTMEGAYILAERIRAAVCEQAIVASDTVVLTVTVSIGLAEMDVETTEGATTLYRAAGTRLYIAKHSGRNQISTDAIRSMH